MKNLYNLNGIPTCVNAHSIAEEYGANLYKSLNFCAPKDFETLEDFFYDYGVKFDDYGKIATYNRKMLTTKKVMQSFYDNQIELTTMYQHFTITTHFCAISKDKGPLLTFFITSDFDREYIPAIQTANYPRFTPYKLVGTKRRLKNAVDYLAELKEFSFKVLKTYVKSLNKK